MNPPPLKIDCYIRPRVHALYISNPKTVRYALQDVSKAKKNLSDKFNVRFETKQKNKTFI